MISREDLNGTTFYTRVSGIYRASDVTCPLCVTTAVRRRGLVAMQDGRRPRT